MSGVRIEASQLEDNRTPTKPPPPFHKYTRLPSVSNGIIKPPVNTSKTSIKLKKIHNNKTIFCEKTLMIVHFRNAYVKLYI